MTIWGNFITTNNPSISAAVANGVNGTGDGMAATDWPVWTLGGAGPQMVNLNETGGQPFQMSVGTGSPNSTEFEEPGLRNQFSVVNAYTWEGGRGTRCDFWRSVGVVVPE